jgi:hypothetical protein
VDEKRADGLDKAPPATKGGINNRRGSGPASSPSHGGSAGMMKVGQTGTKVSKVSGKDTDGGAVAANDTRRKGYKSGSNATGTKTTGPTTSAKGTGTVRKKK